VYSSNDIEFVFFLLKGALKDHSWRRHPEKIRQLVDGATRHRSNMGVMAKPSIVTPTASGEEGKAVQHDRSNHGVEGSRAVSAQDERTWSVLAHLSMFLNLLTGFLGPVASLIIYLVYKDRSSRVAFDALQSMWYQIGWLVILAVGWILTTLLMVVSVGFLLIPVMIVVSVLPFVHAGYAAYKVNQGDEYRYPVAAGLAERR
jgi:uncharacterized Tic20 family protein